MHSRLSDRKLINYPSSQRIFGRELWRLREQEKRDLLAYYMANKRDRRREKFWRVGRWIKRNIFLIDTAQLFVDRVRRDARKRINYITYYSYSKHFRPTFREFEDPLFRTRVLAMLQRDPEVMNANFVGPDRFDDEWMFQARCRPDKITPGHCLACNHPFVRDFRCEEPECQADQTFRLWLKSPSRRKRRGPLAWMI